jgi:Tfp pilus assembly protein PilN
MRLNINLASRKFEDVQRFYVVRSTSLAILAVLALGLAVLAYLKFARDRQAAAQVSDLQQKIAVLERQRNELSAADRLPENREVTQQKQYWNTQIMKRAFSWTTLFNELQKIMPNRAYLNTVQPELTADNRLKLRITIIGEHKSDALDLIERMETSKRFHLTRPLSEALQQPKKGEPPTYKFEIETYYTPAAAPVEKPATKEGA